MRILGFGLQLEIRVGRGAGGVAATARYVKHCASMPSKQVESHLRLHWKIIKSSDTFLSSSFRLDGFLKTSGT